MNKWSRCQRLGKEKRPCARGFFTPYEEGPYRLLLYPEGRGCVSLLGKGELRRKLVEISQPDNDWTRKTLRGHSTRRVFRRLRKKKKKPIAHLL